MSEEQREWKQQLANSREDLEVKVDDILQEMARSIVKISMECSTKKTEVGVQTDKVDLLDSQPVITGDNGTKDGETARPLVNGVMVNPPLHSTSTSIIERPLPEDAELLRAELAAASTQIIEQESSIRSLHQLALNLRETLTTCYKEREDLVIQLRHAQAQELTHRSVRDRIGLDLERATMEVERLRDAIRTFHYPSSRPYQSVRDAVLREMRGEPPITPTLLKRTLPIEGSDEEAKRSRKRQKSISTSPVRPQPQLSIEAPMPQRSATLPDLPRLRTDIEPHIQLRPSQSASSYGSQPSSADRPTFNHAQLYAGPQQQVPRFVYQPQEPPNHDGHARPQGPPIFIRPIQPPQGAAQRPQTTSNPSNLSLVKLQSQVSAARSPVSVPLPARDQHGQSHSRSRSSSNTGMSSHGNPTPNLNPNLNHNPNLPLFPSQETLTHHLQANPTAAQHPVSPGIALPLTWQVNNGQSNRGNGQPPRPNFQPSGHPQHMSRPPGNNQLNPQPLPQRASSNNQPLQRPSFSSATGPPPLQRSVPASALYVDGSQANSQLVIDLTSQMASKGKDPSRSCRLISMDVTNPASQQIFMLLYGIDNTRKLIQCRSCSAILPSPLGTGRDLSEAFNHSILHKGEFDAACEAVYPRYDLSASGTVT